MGPHGAKNCHLLRCTTRVICGNDSASSTSPGHPNWQATSLSTQCCCSFLMARTVSPLPSFSFRSSGQETYLASKTYCHVPSCNPPESTRVLVLPHESNLSWASGLLQHPTYMYEDCLRTIMNNGRTALPALILSKRVPQRGPGLDERSSRSQSAAPSPPSASAPLSPALIERSRKERPEQEGDERVVVVGGGPLA